MPFSIIQRISNVFSEKMKKLGYVFYVDGTRISQGTGQSIVSGVRTKILIDGLGGTTQIGGRNDLPLDVWDVVNSKIQPVKIHDNYLMRLTFTFEASTGTGDKKILLELDIGNGTPIVIWSDDKTIIKGTDPQTISKTVDLFSLNTFVANGGALYITTDVNGSLYNANIKVTKYFDLFNNPA